MTARKLNFDKFSSGEPYKKPAVTTWNLETISAVA
jgi:hypothetical protein